MKLFRIILVLFSFFIAFSSCASDQLSCQEILDALIEGSADLPAGDIYRHTSKDSSADGYMSSYLMEAMYGEGFEENFALLQEYSIYISSFEAPYEIAVFKCYSRSDGLKIERMCRRRADTVSVALRETSYYYLCDNIRVVREGEYVVFIMTDEPKKTERTVKKLI